MDVLVVYDIATVSRGGERRLAKVAAVCERYGMRIQKSVFECCLNATLLERLKNELMDVMDPNVDQIDIYRFDRAIEEARTSFGRSQARRGGAAWIFGSTPNLQ